MESGFQLIQAFIIGAGITFVVFILLAIYFRVSPQIQNWLANLKMKSLFWRDQRRQTTNRKSQ